jgi:hypothetical protein
MLRRSNAPISAGIGTRNWTFLSNHGHVMVAISQNPDIRVAEIADLVGIGERAAVRIVQDLVEGGYLTRTKVGRRNSYSIDYSQSLRHPLESEHAISEIFLGFSNTKPLNTRSKK